MGAADTGPAPDSYGWKYQGDGVYLDNSGLKRHYGNNGWDYTEDASGQRNDVYTQPTGALYDRNGPEKGYLGDQAKAGYGQFTDPQNAIAARMAAAQIGSTAQMDAAKLGPANMVGGTTIDQTASNQGRDVQMELLSRLAAQSQGQGPSLAGEQLKAGADANLANMASFAASSGGMGGSAALAQRNLALQGAQQGQQTSQAAALARMQEQLNAQQQLGGLASGMRSQDLSVAGQQAQMEQAAAMANAGALNQYGLAQAGFNQGANQFNAGAINSQNIAQAQLAQGASLANLQSQQQQHGMNIGAGEYYYGQMAAQSEADREARIRAWGIQHGIDQQNYENKMGEFKMFAGAAGMAMGAAVGGPVGAGVGYSAGQKAAGG